MSETNETLTYSEQLTSMVKSNHQHLALEAQLLKAKKHFKKRSKNELIDIYANLIVPEKLTSKKRDGLHYMSKNALIAVVIKQWLVRKQEEITQSKEIMNALETSPEAHELAQGLLNDLASLEETKELKSFTGELFETCDYETETFYSLIDLPETSNWDNTGFSEMLDRAITSGAKTLITPDGSKYEIKSNSQVVGLRSVDTKRGESKNFVHIDEFPFIEGNQNETN